MSEWRQNLRRVLALVEQRARQSEGDVGNGGWHPWRQAWAGLQEPSWGASASRQNGRGRLSAGPCRAQWNASILLSKVRKLPTQTTRMTAARSTSILPSA